MLDNKFGMFIHWGPYAEYGIHEQCLAKANIPFEEYEAKARQFNPTEYDPEEWVLLAKNAGMKYICFTAKHHDGFCMWDTKYTDYNIMNTPYGKDVLKMLADACEKHGMLLSIYYSNPDWYREDSFNIRSSHQPRQKVREGHDYRKYLEFKKNQIGELLTNYGKIYTLFWDIPPMHSDGDLKINDYARSLQPDILINDRGHDIGDFSTPEREIPEGGRFTRMTEACESIGEQAWGYRIDEDCHSFSYLTSAVDQIMARGGNYLLNVGPMANGKVTEQQKDMLAKVGAWYNKMSFILENNQAEPRTIVPSNPKSIVNSKNGKTYIHLYERHFSTALVLKELTEMPKKATLVNDGRELRLRKGFLPKYSSFYGPCIDEYISVCDIPSDEFAGETMIIELEW